LRSTSKLKLKIPRLLLQAIMLRAVYLSNNWWKSITWLRIQVLYSKKYFIRVCLIRLIIWISWLINLQIERRSNLTGFIYFLGVSSCQICSIWSNGNYDSLSHSESLRIKIDVRIC
jgi:hypothetical protein